MKKLILLVSIIFNATAYAQYSAYYNINTKSNVNVDANVKYSGSLFEYKTITTIDYGALQLANAQREKNNLEQQKFADEKQKQIAFQIIEDPLKAYDYGSWLNFSSQDKNFNKSKEGKNFIETIKEKSGFSKFRIDYVVPFLIFTYLNMFQVQNVSSDGVKTDVILILPNYNKEKKMLNVESEFENVVIGKEIEEPDEQNKLRKTVFHKKELNRATVFGFKGYRSTYIWEDKFEYCLTDNYILQSDSFGNGYTVGFKVRYYGNKSEVDFEKLEGRRYFLKPLIERVVSTAKVSDLKIY